MERGRTELRLRVGEHRRVEIDALDVELVAEVHEVATGAARDIEQRARVGPPSADLLGDAAGLGGIVLAARLGDEVVRTCAVLTHGLRR